MKLFKQDGTYLTFATVVFFLLLLTYILAKKTFDIPTIMLSILFVYNLIVLLLFKQQNYKTGKPQQPDEFLRSHKYFSRNLYSTINGLLISILFLNILENINLLIRVVCAIMLIVSIIGLFVEIRYLLKTKDRQ